MKRNLITLMGLTLAGLAATAGLASPVQVRTAGTKGQHTFMCPDCKTKVACAQVGDYRIGLVVDVDNPKLGTGKVVAHVQDKNKKPVNDAAVTATLSMPDHKHALEPLTLKSRGKGEYAAPVHGLGMTGGWNALVEVNVGGDKVHQTFSFAR